MKGHEDESIYTEEEAIKITIEHGYDGSEFNTSKWKTRGCLMPDRTLDALVKKLETIYDSVTVEGKGKKRRYILYGNKEQVTEIQYNYKGSVPTNEDELMKEYIHGKLLALDKTHTLSYKGWARVLNFCNTEELSIDKMIEVIKDLYGFLPVPYNPKEIVSKFLYTLNVRTKDVIEKSFKRLEEEGKIIVYEEYNFKLLDDQVEEVSQRQYDEAECGLKLFLESKEVTFHTYTQSVTGFYRSKKMEKVIKEVEEYLESHFNIKYFFKSYKVLLTEHNSHRQQVSRDEFNQAYFKRLIKLTQDRQAKNTYNNSLYFWQKFYLLNTLALLNHMKVDGVGEMLINEKNLMSDRIDEFTLDVLIEQSEAEKEKKKRRNSFG